MKPLTRRGQPGREFRDVKPKVFASRLFFSSQRLHQHSEIVLVALVTAVFIALMQPPISDRPPAGSSC